MARSKRKRALLVVGLTYLVAAAVAVLVGWAVRSWHPIAVVAVADVAATLVVFGFSVGVNNSSMYDPYWSVAPVAIGLYFSWLGVTAGVSPLRQVMVLALVGVWAARLTYNCLRRWRDLQHEDWRYADYRARAGQAYWLVSLTGFHLMPTLAVFLGCLPLYAALSVGRQPLGWLDGLAVAITLLAIGVETRADQQLYRFIASGQAPGTTLCTGLWGYCRHPNYLGEILFWWGLALLGLAAAPQHGWTVVGAVAITLLFVVISIPMIDRRMVARRADYRNRMKTVPALIPRLPR